MYQIKSSGVGFFGRIRRHGPRVKLRRQHDAMVEIAGDGSRDMVQERGGQVGSAEIDREERKGLNGGSGICREFAPSSRWCNVD